MVSKQPPNHTTPCIVFLFKVFSFYLSVSFRTIRQNQYYGRIEFYIHHQLLQPCTQKNKHHYNQKPKPKIIRKTINRSKKVIEKNITSITFWSEKNLDLFFHTSSHQIKPIRFCSFQLKLANKREKKYWSKFETRLNREKGAKSKSVFSSLFVSHLSKARDPIRKCVANFMISHLYLCFQLKDQIVSAYDFTL